MQLADFLTFLSTEKISILLVAIYPVGSAAWLRISCLPE